MSDNFQKTVNLRDKLESESKAKTQGRKKLVEKLIKNSRINRSAEQIDELYSKENRTAATRRELQHIEKANKSSNEDFLKKMIFVLIIALMASFYYIFFYNKSDVINVNEAEDRSSSWYAVKLVSGEVYYGQVIDPKADPVSIKNVYYDYDQISSNEEGKDKASNLRLVKRGKETHGPDGSMEIIRAQVKYIEPLKDGSKVLSAILDYEK